MELGKCQTCGEGYIGYCKKCAGEIPIVEPPPKIDWGVECVCRVCGEVVMRNNKYKNAICWQCRQEEKKQYYNKHKAKYLAKYRAKAKVDKLLAKQNQGSIIKVEGLN